MIPFYSTKSKLDYRRNQAMAKISNLATLENLDEVRSDILWYINNLVGKIKQVPNLTMGHGKNILLMKSYDHG